MLLVVLDQGNRRKSVWWLSVTRSINQVVPAMLVSTDGILYLIPKLVLATSFSCNSWVSTRISFSISGITQQSAYLFYRSHAKP